MKQRRFTSFRPYLEELESRLSMSGPGANNPGVLPPQSHPFGATYGEWAARWWQWAFKQPVDTNPLFDETGARIANGQSGHVWFLAGVINVSGTAHRTGTIPAGRALFFPIINFEADNLAPPMDPPLDVAGLRKLAAFNVNGATLEADVDGRAIQNLQAYRVQSPVFSVTFPNNNVFQSFGFDVPAGTYSLPDGFVDDGYYLMLAPLSVGQHTIHFHGSVPATSFTLDITYELNVVGGQGARTTGTADRTLTADPGIASFVVQAPGTTVGTIQVAVSAPPPGSTFVDPGSTGLVAALPLPDTGAAVGSTQVAVPAPPPGTACADDLCTPPWDPVLVGAL